MAWFSLPSRAPWWEPDGSENATTLDDDRVVRLTDDQAALARSLWALRPRPGTTLPGGPTLPTQPPVVDPVTPFTPGLIPALLGATL